MARVVGIDLGTSNSCASIMARGAPERVEPLDSRHLRVTPTVIGLIGKTKRDSDGNEIVEVKRVIGNQANTQRKTNPLYTFVGLKRLVGRQFDDPFVQALMKQVSYGIVEGPNGAAWLQGPDRTYAPEELLADVLRKIKADVEHKTQERVSHAVIAAPVYFDMRQKACLVDAAQRAGLEILRIVAEPTSAALAYSIDKENKPTVVVYDFGGGTFDVSILQANGRKFKKLASAGDPFLGGLDFDTRLVGWLLEEFEAETGIDPRGDKFALQRLYEAAEKAKIELSSSEEIAIEIGFLARDPITQKPATLDRTITREFFEHLCADLIARSLAPCQEALAAAKKAFSGELRIDDVVLVGGMTLMPAVRAAVEEVFGVKPRTDINPDEAVASGCAIMGAAMQGMTSALSLNERTALSIGLEEADGSFVPLIKKNTRMPHQTKPILFTTVNDFQRAVTCRIYEGETDGGICGDKRHVGTLLISGIPAAPAGVPQIAVMFAVDASGKLTARMTDTHDDHPAEAFAEIHTASGLTEAELKELREMADL